MGRGQGMTILLMVAFRATLAISGIDWRRSALVPLLVVLMAAVLPWRDGLTELVFQLNYIPGTAFTMLLLVWLRKRQAYGAAVCMAAFAFGLLAGGWHGGIGLPAGRKGGSGSIASGRARHEGADGAHRCPGARPGRTYIFHYGGVAMSGGGCLGSGPSDTRPAP